MLTVVKLAWYLCAVLLMGTLVASAITVVHELESERDVAVGLTGFASLMFGGLAAYLTKRYGKPGQSENQPPKWLLRLLQGLAVVATFFVLVVIG